MKVKEVEFGDELVVGKKEKWVFWMAFRFLVRETDLIERLCKDMRAIRKKIENLVLNCFVFVIIIFLLKYLMVIEKEIYI